MFVLRHVLFHAYSIARSHLSSPVTVILLFHILLIHVSLIQLVLVNIPIVTCVQGFLFDCIVLANHFPQECPCLKIDPSRVIVKLLKCRPWFSIATPFFPLLGGCKGPEGSVSS